MKHCLAAAMAMNLLALAAVGAGSPAIDAPASLPPGRIDVPYTFTFIATGGIPPYTWSAISGAPPSGVEFDDASGVLAGVPDTEETAGFVVVVSDATNVAATGTFSMVVGPDTGGLFYETAGLPPALVGQPYTEGILVSGGTPPYRWHIVAGATPAGIVLSTNTGILAGSPSTAGKGSFTVAMSDAAGGAVTNPYSITVLDVTNQPMIVPGTLPPVVISNPVNIAVSALNMAPPVTWDTSAGTLLPDNLLLDPDLGVIYGTPVETGSFLFGIEATDLDLNTVERQYVWTIVPPPLGPTLPMIVPPNGVPNTPYLFQTEANGGAPPYAYALLDSLLPSGMVFYVATATLAGQTAETGTFWFVVRATDTNGLSAVRHYAFSIAYSSDLHIDTTYLPQGWVGKTYQLELQCAGGTAPYLWQVASGDPSLPPGIHLAGNTLNGVPSTGGVFYFTMRAIDNDGQVKERLFSLEINPAPEALAFATTELPGGVYGEKYESHVYVKGGIPPYTWSVLPGTGMPPPGVVLLPDTGVMGGFPVATGLFSFVCRVTDAETNAITRLFSVPVAPQGGNLQFITSYLPDGSVFNEYYEEIHVSGGAPPYSWKLAAGTLPVGLALATNTGAIIGTPSGTGTYQPLVTVVDGASGSVTRLFSFTIHSQPPQLAIDTDTIDEGYVSNDYEFAFTVHGGKKPYTWTQPSGTLPPGLLFNTDGTLSGTPTTYGAWAFSIRVRDGFNSNVVRGFVMKVFNDTWPEIVTEDLPPGKAGHPYTTQLESFGGTPPFRWRIDDGDLPPGLSFNTNNGTIAGIVSSSALIEEEYQIDFEVLDFAGESDLKTLVIPIDSLDITTIKSSSFKINWNMDKYDLDMFSIKFMAVLPQSFTGFLPDTTTLYVEFADYSASSDFGVEKINGSRMTWSTKVGDPRKDRDFGGRIDVPYTTMKLSANTKKRTIMGDVKCKYDDSTGFYFGLEDTEFYVLTNYPIRVELIIDTNMYSFVGNAGVQVEYKNGGKHLMGTGKLVKPK